MCKGYYAAGVWLVLTGMLGTLPATATTVYRTVGENGVVTFSDTPPDPGTEVETLVIDTPAGAGDEVAQQRLEDMRATTDRMVADRLAREKHRAELRRLQAETATRRAELDYIPYYPETRTVVGGYHRRHWRRGHRPEHPVVRPPLRPPGHVRPPLARPLPVVRDYPASLVRRHYDPKTRAAFR